MTKYWQKYKLKTLDPAKILQFYVERRLREVEYRHSFTAQTTDKAL